MSKQKETLCWSCKNAVPSKKAGCSWSEKFEPVEGWIADKTFTKCVSDNCPSYFVRKCPEFEKG